VGWAIRARSAGATPAAQGWGVAPGRRKAWRKGPGPTALNRSAPVNDSERKVGWLVGPAGGPRPLGRRAHSQARPDEDNQRLKGPRSSSYPGPAPRVFGPLLPGPASNKTERSTPSPSRGAGTHQGPFMSSELARGPSTPASRFHALKETGAGGPPKAAPNDYVAGPWPGGGRSFPQRGWLESPMGGFLDPPAQPRADQGAHGPKPRAPCSGQRAPGRRPGAPRLPGLAVGAVSFPDPAWPG